MSEIKISETAFAIASIRALSNYEEKIEIRSNDNYAEMFIPDEKREALFDRNSREIIKRSLPAGLYEYVIARTRYFDEIFIESLSHKIEQIVILGAGFDTRAYRFADLLGKTRVFEVDIRSTQSYKLSILKNNKINIAQNISYVSSNFETDDLLSTLENREYNRNRKTLFLLEGVSFYLTENAVFEILEFIKMYSGVESLLCFDFQSIQDEEDLIDTGIENENVKFGIKESEINSFVFNNGFSVMRHLSSSDMEKMFLTLNNGEIFGRINPIMHFLLINNAV